MANPIPHSRTNYFRVKDIDAFLADLSAYGISHGDWESYSDLVVDQSPSNQPAGAIALFTTDFWPSFDEDSVADRLEIEDPEVEVPTEHESIEELIAAHLVETDVAVIMGIDHEKLRYVSGYAVAVNARGETRSLRLDDIYEQAREIATEGTEVTHALY